MQQVDGSKLMVVDGWLPYYAGLRDKTWRSGEKVMVEIVQSKLHNKHLKI